MQNIDPNRSVSAMIQQNRMRSVLIGTGVVVGLGALAVNDHMKHSAFEARLNNSLTGTLAYGIDNNIRVIPASEIVKVQRHQRTFQTDTSPHCLSWLDQDTIVFAGPVNKTQKPTELPTQQSSTLMASVNSDGIYVLNLKEGKITRIFDPYSPAATLVFGDLRSKDAAIEAEINNPPEKSQGRGSITIRFGNPSAMNVEVISASSDGSAIYFKTSETWYQLTLSGAISKPTEISGNFQNSQIDSPDGVFRISRPTIMHEYRITDGSVDGRIIENGANSPVWSKY